MIKEIKSWFIFSFTSLLVFILAWIVYASTVTNWQTLTAELFNEKTVPTWAVMAFNLTSCPNWWKIADGTNWTQDLRDEFIRWVSATRPLWNKENATKVISLWEFWSLDGNIYFWADRWLRPSDYDSEVRWTTQRQWRIRFDGSYETNNTLVNWIRVRPQNVALLFCEKE